MSEVTKSQIEAELADYIEPHLEKDLISAKAVKEIKIDGSKVQIDIEVGFPMAGAKDELETALKNLCEALSNVNECVVNVSWKILAHSVQKALKPIDNVKNIINRF